MQYLTSVGSYNVLQQKDYCLYVSLASLFQTALHFCHLGWHRWVVLGSLVLKASIVGSVVECSPATRAARVRFPDNAVNFYFTCVVSGFYCTL